MDAMIVHCARRTDVGIFAMGAMLPAEYREYCAHIIDCPSCSAELAELIPVLATLEAVSPSTSSDEPIPDTLRASVLSAFTRSPTESSLSSLPESPAIVSVESIQRSEVTDPLEAKTPGRRIGSWKLFAVAASLILLTVSVVALINRGGSNTVTKRYQLVALEKDPLRATALLSTKDDTTVAEFVVDGTIPGEIYFAWFEDPKGARVGLGSFRGAAGRVRFRGQTGVAREDLAAVGATTRKGEVRTDRMRAEIPRA